MSTYVLYNPDTELYHHGILGQKWGVRRFQNADGTYTAAGKKRYEIDESGRKSSAGKRREKGDREANYYATKAKHEYDEAYRKSSKSYRDDSRANLRDSFKGENMAKDIGWGMLTGVVRTRGNSAATNYWRGEQYEKKLEKSMDKYGTGDKNIASKKLMSDAHQKAGKNFVERTKDEKVSMVATDAAVSIGLRVLTAPLGLPVAPAMVHTRGELKYKTNYHD